jgi:hypothetical protein
MKILVTIALICTMALGCNKAAQNENPAIGKSRHKDKCSEFLGTWVNDDNPYYPFYLQIKKKDGKFVVKSIPRSSNLNGSQLYAAVCTDEGLELSGTFGSTITYFNENGVESILSGGDTYTRYVKKKKQNQ